MAMMGMTKRQLEQFEIQVQVYKAFVHGAPVPSLFLAKLQRYEDERIHGFRRCSSPGLSSSYSAGPIYPLSARDFSAFAEPGFAQGYGNPFCPQRRSKSASLLAADPNPSRCRRTDGKRWRCTRSVTTDGGHYCQRHSCRKKAEGDSAAQSSELNPDESESKQQSRSTKEESHQSGSFGQADSPSTREVEVASPEKPSLEDKHNTIASRGVTESARTASLGNSGRSPVCGNEALEAKSASVINTDSGMQIARGCRKENICVQPSTQALGGCTLPRMDASGPGRQLGVSVSPGVPITPPQSVGRPGSASPARQSSMGAKLQPQLAQPSGFAARQQPLLLPLVMGEQPSPVLAAHGDGQPESMSRSARSISVLPASGGITAASGLRADDNPYVELVKEMVEKQGGACGSSGACVGSAPVAGPMGAYPASLPLLGDIFSDMKGSGAHNGPVRHMKPVAYPKVASWDPSFPRSPIISVTRALGDLRRRGSTGNALGMSGASVAASAPAAACGMSMGMLAAMSGVGLAASSPGMPASFGTLGMASSSGRTLSAGTAPLQARTLSVAPSFSSLSCPSLPAVSCPSRGVARSDPSLGATWSESAATTVPAPLPQEHAGWNPIKGGHHHRAKGHGVHDSRLVMSYPPDDEVYSCGASAAVGSAPSTPSLLELKRKFSRAMGYDMWSMQQQQRNQQEQQNFHNSGRRQGVGAELRRTSNDSDEYGEVDSCAAVSRSSMSCMETIIQEGLQEGLRFPGVPGKRVRPMNGGASLSMDVSSGQQAGWETHDHLAGAGELLGHTVDALADFDLDFDSQDMELLQDNPPQPLGCAGGVESGLGMLGKASGSLLDVVECRRSQDEDLMVRFC